MKNFEVIPVKSSVCRQWIMKKHYARRLPQIIYAFALLYDKKVKGILTFGRPVGAMVCASVCGKEYKPKVFEFNRLFIDLPSEERKNVASWFCSKAIKMLPEGLILISYADINQGHIGYVYQSLNWLYTGLGAIGAKEIILKDGRSKHQRWAKMYHSENEIAEVKDRKPKHRCIYFTGSKRIKKKLRRALLFQVLPYPKGESIKYDDSGEMKPVNVGLGLIPIRKSNLGEDI